MPLRPVSFNYVSFVTRAHSRLNPAYRTPNEAI